MLTLLSGVLSASPLAFAAAAPSRRIFAALADVAKVGLDAMRRTSKCLR